MIYQAQPKDFLEILAKHQFANFFFYNQEDSKSAQVKKINTQLKDIYSDNPNIDIYTFVTDSDEQVAEFSKTLGLDGIPTLVVFKNCNFNRYKNKDFTPASIKKFIGTGMATKKTHEV